MELAVMLRGTSPVLLAAALSLAGCDSCDPDPNPRHYEPATCVGTRDETPAEELDCAHDEYEPNGDLPRASVSPREHECFDTVKSANIANGDDVDVYRTGKCDLSNGFARAANVITTTADIETKADLRMCVFPACHGGSTNVFACYETTDGEETEVVPTRTHSGFIGCCRVGTGSVTAELDCPLRGLEVDTYLWVEAADVGIEGTCHPYTLHWNFLGDGRL
jgi:hypothetical protein